ncbi:MAG: response regulator [Betaproteobacteria bacterium]
MTKQAAPSEGPRQDSTPAPAPLRVLVVDDDRDTVISLMLLLRDEGYDTRSAGTAGQAWQSIEQFDPDVLLLDIGLPDRNGYELARDIRKRFGAERPALIAVTGWNKGADKLLAQIAGFDSHIGKPYEPQALLRLVKQLASPK